MSMATSRHRLRIRPLLAQAARALPRPESGLEIAGLRLYPVPEPASGRAYTVLRATTRSGLTGYGGQVKPSPQDKIWEEWFGFPAMRMNGGRFTLRDKPGLGFELSEASLAKYPFGGTRPMARVFHDDGSVAEW